MNSASKSSSNARSRVDLTAGTLYAVQAESGWIYYGQVTPEKKIGFFRCRSRKRPPISTILALDRRLGMASAVVRGLVPDIEVQRRLLERATDLVARQRGQDRPDPPRTRAAD